MVQQTKSACLEALRLNSDPARWREGEAVTVMLQMLRFEYRPVYLLPWLSGKNVFVVWFRPSRQFVPRLDHDRFLPNPFWFIRNQSSYSSTCIFWVMDSVVKINHKTVFVSHRGYRLLRTQYNHRRPLQSAVHTAVERAITLQSLECTSDAATAGLRRQSLLSPQYEIWFGLD